MVNFAYHMILVMSALALRMVEDEKVTMLSNTITICPRLPGTDDGLNVTHEFLCHECLENMLESPVFSRHRIL